MHQWNGRKTAGGNERCSKCNLIRVKAGRGYSYKRGPSWVLSKSDPLGRTAPKCDPLGSDETKG